MILMIWLDCQPNVNGCRTTPFRFWDRTLWFKRNIPFGIPLLKSKLLSTLLVFKLWQKQSNRRANTILKTTVTIANIQFRSGLFQKISAHPKRGVFWGGFVLFCFVLFFRFAWANFYKINLDFQSNLSEKWIFTHFHLTCIIKDLWWAWVTISGSHDRESQFPTFRILLAWCLDFQPFLDGKKSEFPITHRQRLANLLIFFPGLQGAPTFWKSD